MLLSKNANTEVFFFSTVLHIHIYTLPLLVTVEDQKHLANIF